jgi:hypothetical protein
MSKPIDSNSLNSRTAPAGRLDAGQLDRVVGGAGHDDYETPPCSDPRNQALTPGPAPTPVGNPPPR